MHYLEFFSHIDGGSIGTFTTLIKKGKGSCFKHKMASHDMSRDSQKRQMPWGVLPYMGYIGMCRCEGYGFQEVYSRIGYINQSAWA